MDCDNNKVHFAVNGVYTNSSNPVNNTNGFAMLDDYQYFAMATYIGSYALKANFGGYTTISISSAASDATATELLNTHHQAGTTHYVQRI